MNPRLLCLLPTRERGGAEEYALTIARGARSAGWEAHAAFPDVDGTQSLIADFAAAGIAYHAIDLCEPSGMVDRDLPNLVRSWQLLWRVRPEAVHITLPAPTCGFGSMIACCLSRIPAVVVFQLVPPTVPIRWRQRHGSIWCGAHNQQWVAVSRNNRDSIARIFGIPHDAVRVVYNGTRLSESEESKPLAVRRSVRDEFGMGEHARILLTVGRLHEQKGHALMVPAIGPTAGRFPGTKFLWVGDGSERVHLQRMVDRAGGAEHVVFAGYRTDVPRLMRGADLFLFPTLFEGQPFAVLEAMAAGLPIVSSDASGIPEVIENEEHGVLFPTGDSQALTSALTYALRHEDRMREMAERARARVREFSEERMVAETLALFDVMASRGKTLKADS